MPERDAASAREREVWDRLDRVCDPELDEPITDMGFVEDVKVTGADVDVSFRLPTYWCSPNFAFLMAEGVRREAVALPWSERVRVHLEDHLCSDEMNAAVNAGRTFSDAFALREDGGDLDEVKEKFDRKAFLRRQETVLTGLRTLGWAPADLASLKLADFCSLALDEDAGSHRDRYVEKLVARGLAIEPDDPAFPDLDGIPLTEAGFADRMSALRMIRINMEFSGALCRGLKQARYKEVVEVDGEPTLVDFILDRVPPRADSAQPADTSPANQ